MNEQSNGKKNELQPMLQSIVRSTAATGAMVWDCDAMPFREVEFFYAEDAGPIRLGCSPTDHIELIGSVAQTKRPKVAIPRSEGVSETDVPVLALAPLNRDDRSWVVEAFLAPNLTNDAYKQSLASILEILDSSDSDSDSDSEKLPSPSGFATPSDIESPLPNVAVDASQISDYCSEIHQAIETKDAAYRIANETRRFLNVDRVSLVKFAGKRSKIVAISGQQSVNRRSNTVSLLERLARKVLPLRNDFYYPEDDASHAPQVESVLNDYLKLSVSRTIAILPLFEKAKVEIEHASERPGDDKLIGGLIIEHFTDDWDVTIYKPLIQTAAKHSANAYSNALNLESLFLYPVWRTLGRTKFATTARNLPISISILIGVLILVACLIFVPREFKVVANGSMVPEKIQYVFAPGNGKVVRIVNEGTRLVESQGDQQSDGQSNDQNVGQIAAQNIEEIDPALIYSRNGKFELGQIVDPELEERRTDAKGKIEELKARIADRERGFAGSRRDDEPTGESLSELNSQLKSRQESLALIEKQIANLRLTSSLPGQVLTHSTRDKFLGRPVTEGALLLEIGDVDGDWIVELKMPDDRIGHILNAQRRLREELDVTFVLSTDPSKSFSGTIINVARATEVDQEKGQTVLIKVKIDGDVNKSLLRARAQVIGKVHCGQRSLGYVWFHQIGEFMQKNVWFRIW